MKAVLDFFSGMTILTFNVLICIGLIPVIMTLIMLAVLDWAYEREMKKRKTNG